MTTAAPTMEMVETYHDTSLREWGLVIVLALIPALPLLIGSGLVNTRAGGDSPFLLLRVHQLVLSLRAGTFPVRWMPQAAYGLGYPFFNFYASLPYYLAAALKLSGAGYIWSIKLTQALGFVFAAMAIYGLSRELLHTCASQLAGAGTGGAKRAASLLVAFAYSCAPFHVINIYVRGDSLSEFYAFVFFPLILWAMLRLHKRPNTRNAAWVALSYAGLMLTHNVSALIFSPFVLAYALWLALSARDRLQNAIKSLSALGGGAFMSAWFWLPALAERANVHLKEMTTGYFNYALHFRGLNLVQRSLVFNYAIAADRQPFCMGLVQAALAMAGLIAVLVRWVKLRRVESHSALVVFLLAISTFMITPLSRPLWDHLPLLPMVQFPWRFLSLQALATSLIAAYLVPQQPCTSGRKRRRWSLLVAASLGLLVLLTTLLGLQPERLHIREEDITAQRLMLYEYFTANVGTTIRHDYLPRWVDPRPYTSEALWQEGTKPAPLTIEGRVSSARLIALGPTSESWAIEVTSPESLLAFHTYYYPGWKAHVDGQAAKIEVLPGLGYVGLRLGQGRHEVSLRLGHTPVQLFAEVLSALAAGVLLSMLILRRNHDNGFVVATSVASSASTTTKAVTTNLQSRFSWRTPAIIATTLMALVLLAMGTRLLPSQGVSEQRLDLTMDFDRMPYLHHNPDGIRFGNAAQLTHYELSSQAIQAGEILTVTTYWEDIRRADLVTKMALVSPAQHLFAVPHAVAVSEKPLTGGCVQHVLRIPASTVRGIYLLSLQVHGPEGEIEPVTTRGETLGTTYLLPVHISGEIPASGDEPILQQFGERIALSRVQTIQQMAGTVEVTLTWRVFASPAQNYKTALRLKDPSGWDVARLDTQPGYGFYPTSMWRAGELVNDHYTLSLDDGTPPGARYCLHVTLYEAASLRPIGTARIPNVVIAQPTVRPGYEVLYQFGPAIILSEARLSKGELEQGEDLEVLLKWAATTRVDQDYECRVALLNQAGAVAYSRTMPLVSGYATSLWPQDAVVASHYELALDSDFPTGEYTITMMVLEALSRKEMGTFTFPTAVRVVEAARSFAIPEMQKSVGADFGGRIRLLGYDLERTERELLLTLYWQALSAMTTDYKIFVHLFDPTTEHIVAQKDVLAGGDRHPTTRWVPTEVVSDSIALSLEDAPAGVYRLGVGLYHPDGRLPVVAPPGFTVSADRLLLDETVPVP